MRPSCTVVFNLLRLFVASTRSTYNRRCGCLVLHSLVYQRWVEHPAACAVVLSVFYFRTLIDTVASYVSVSRALVGELRKDALACRAAEVAAGLASPGLQEYASKRMLSLTLYQLRTYHLANIEVHRACDTQLIMAMVNKINTEDLPSPYSTDYSSGALMLLGQLADVMCKERKTETDTRGKGGSVKAAICIHFCRLLVESGYFTALTRFILSKEAENKLHLVDYEFSILNHVCVGAKTVNNDSDENDLLRKAVLSSGAIPLVVRALKDTSRSVVTWGPMVEFLAAIVDADTGTLTDTGIEVATLSPSLSPSANGSTSECLEVMRTEGATAALQSLAHKGTAELREAIARIISRL